MTCEIRESPTGLSIPYVDGKPLLSPLNPRQQMERYCASRDIQGARIILILFPPSPLLSEIMAQLVPQATFLQVVPCSFAPLFKDSGIQYVHPDKLSDALDSILDEDTVRDMRIVDWQPSRKAFPAEFDQASELVMATVKMLTSSLATRWFFASRWFMNSLANMSLPQQTVPTVFRGNLILAASGPSLNCALPFLENPDLQPVICALPSSLSYLHRQGLRPRIIVTSDGGYYADLHLRQYFHSLAMEGDRFDGILLAPVRAQLRCLARYPVSLCLHDHDGLATLGLARGLPEYPDRGSVAFSALDLLRQYHRGPIFVAGMDLSNRFHQSHVLPHTFHLAPYISADRINPVCQSTQTASIAGGMGRIWWATGALEVYARWLHSHAGDYPDVWELPRPMGQDGPAPFFPPRNPGSDTLGQTIIPPSSRDCFPLSVRDIIEKLSREVAAYPSCLDSPLADRVFPRQYHLARIGTKSLAEEKSLMTDWIDRARRALHDN